ncbi:hypothetical protein HDU67_004002, partial [Dinochytrium kinnereticum]
MASICAAPFHLTLNGLLGFGIQQTPTTVDSLPALHSLKSSAAVSISLFGGQHIVTSQTIGTFACVGLALFSYRGYIWKVAKKVLSPLVSFSRQHKRTPITRQNSASQQQIRRKRRRDPEPDLIDFESPIVSKTPSRRTAESLQLDISRGPAKAAKTLHVKTQTHHALTAPLPVKRKEKAVVKKLSQEDIAFLMQSPGEVDGDAGFPKDGILEDDSLSPLQLLEKLVVESP